MEEFLKLFDEWRDMPFNAPEIDKQSLLKRVFVARKNIQQNVVPIRQTTGGPEPYLAGAMAGSTERAGDAAMSQIADVFKSLADNATKPEISGPPMFNLTSQSLLSLIDLALEISDDTTKRFLGLVRPMVRPDCCWEMTFEEVDGLLRFLTWPMPRPIATCRA